jgi:DNA-binding response OmpR family regulator
VHEIVRDHDGAMDVQSKPGLGSRFEVWLPAAAADSAALTGPAMLPLGRGETVLIIERERERLLYDEEMLAALGYEPVGYEHAADAIAACRNEPDRFDAIVVSDAPQTRDGVHLARALRAAAPHQPLLLATASTDHPGLDVLAQVGISEIIRKPLVGSELAAALARGLRRRRH